MLNRTCQRQFFATGKTGAQHQVAGRLFDYRQIDIDLISAAWDFRRFNIHFLEVAKTIHPIPRQPDFSAVIPGILELPEFASYHFIARLCIAGKVDTANIDALAWVQKNRQRDFFFLAVNLRVGIDVSESVTEVTHALRYLGSACRQFFTGIDIAFFQGQQRVKFRLAAKHLTLDLDIGDGVFFPFVDIDGDVDIFFILRDRDLRRLHLHLDITAIQVMGFQRFNIACEFLFRILIGFGVPGKPTGRCQV